MHKKSSAKLGEVKGHRGEKRQEGERSAAWVWLTADWSGLLHTYCLRRAMAACWGWGTNTGGATGADDEVRAVPEVASSRQSEAALGD